MEAMEENARQFPDKTYTVIHVIEDGDFVAVHGKVVLKPKVYGVIHIFRFEDNKIIESWEASQEELKHSPNENGLF
jgi:predicted SnoaL-like aldol condensation-catalyzing enzyme